MKMKMIALLAVLALLMTACAGSADPTAGSSAAPTTAPTTQASKPTDPTTSQPTDPPLDPHPAHCACNGNSVGVGAHICKEITQWIPLTLDCFMNDDGGRMTFKKPGCYYLTGDFDLGKTVNIYANEEVTLCLNGYKIYSKARLFRINGVLDICDCKGTGVATSTTTGLVAVSYIYSGGRCNLFSGTLDGGGVSRQQGGVVAIAANDVGTNEEGGEEAIFTMYGGTITGGTVCATPNSDGKYVGGTGGNVVAFHANSTFFMYGGTIKDGIAEEHTTGGYGGNLHINNGKGYLYGGTITGGKGALGGGGVSINKNATLTISGNMKIVDNNGSNLFIRNGNENTIIVDLGPDAMIGVDTNESYTLIAKNLTADISAHFTSDDPNYQVTYADGVLSLTPVVTG